MCLYGCDTCDNAENRASRNKFVAPTLFLYGCDMGATTCDKFIFSLNILLFD